MLCLECGLRMHDEASPPRRAPEPRALSPVSAYCQGELDAEETKLFFKLQATNRELRWKLGLAGQGMSVSPEVGTQVEEHLARLRFAVAENARLRLDLAKAKESLQAGDAKLDEKAQDSSRGGADVKDPEQERFAAAVMAEIQTVTQANIELISQYDDKVKNLEAELVNERRRRQTAEMELRVPGSMRSLSPIRTSPELPLAALSGRRRSDVGMSPVTDRAQEEDLAKKRMQLQQTEEECMRLTQEIQSEAVIAEARIIQELQLAHDIQREELEHFRKLVQEKRSGGGASPTVTPNTGALLEAELEQLREHLSQVQQKGDQERDAADRQADDLRRETQLFEKDLESVKLERHKCVQDVQKANSEAIAGVSLEGAHSEAERQRGEELSKEVARTTRRIELLDAKIEQLRQEAKDISQRANLVLRAVPDVPGGPESYESPERVAELQELVADRQRQLAALRSQEESLQNEVASAQEAQEAAKVGASVMEQKMKLLKSRLSSASQL